MKKRFFITWVTHNSRYSEKMGLLKMKKQEGYFFDTSARILIFRLISQKLESEGIISYTLNVLSDHIHLVIEYEEEKLSELIWKVKGSTSFNYSRQMHISQAGDGRQYKIWARGFSTTYINSDDQYEKAILYTQNNHKKHDLKNIYPYINRGL